VKRINPEEFGLREIRILIVDDNSPYVLPLLRSFSGSPNIRLDVLIISDQKANHFRFSRFMDRLEIVNTLTDENVDSVIDRVVVDYNSDLIIPTREWLSVLFFRHQTELEKIVRLHPLPEASILKITGNKWNLNEWLKEKGFPHALITKIENGWVGDYPILAKPVSGSGGRGIHLINGPGELDQFKAGLSTSWDGYILQELIEGHDIDVSFFAVDGKIIYHTIQQGVILRKMVYSKGIEFVRNSELLKQVTEIAALLKYTGIAHLDFRYSRDQNAYILIDFNARYWSSVQGSRAMGVNFPLLVAAWTLTNDVETPVTRTGHYYFSTTAVNTMFRNLFSRPKYPIKLKDTQLLYIFSDPLPELMFLAGRIMSAFKLKRGE
jgi:carbamoylphosphate synthase large subunit